MERGEPRRTRAIFVYSDPISMPMIDWDHANASKREKVTYRRRADDIVRVVRLEGDKQWRASKRRCGCLF